MDIEDIKPSEEEIQADAEAQAEVKEDEVREKLATDLGIEDNEDNKDILDKAVAREVEHHGKLSKAVGQKIKYREQLGDKKPDEKKPSTKKTTADEVDPAKAAEEAVEKKLMQRDLDEMDHSDKVKDEIKKISERQGISVRKAEQDSYIQHMIEEEKREAKVNDAAKNGSGKSKSGVVHDTSKPLDPADFDLSTEEGRQEWADAKAARRS